MVDICRYLDIYRYLDIVAAFCQVFGFEVDRAHYPVATGDCGMVRVGHSLMCSQYSAIIKLPVINTSQLLTRLEARNTPEQRGGLGRLIKTIS